MGISAERKVHYLCPKCQKVIHGTITMSLDSPGNSLCVSSAVECPDCGIWMIDVDNLNIPALQKLHRRNYETTASCDRYHDGFVDPDYDYSNEDRRKYITMYYYNGPFIGIRNLSDDEIDALEEAAARVRCEISDDFRIEIQQWDDDDEDIMNCNVSVDGKLPGADNAIKANSLIERVIDVWFGVMHDWGVEQKHKYKPEANNYPYSTLRNMPEAE